MRNCASKWNLGVERGVFISVAANTNQQAGWMKRQGNVRFALHSPKTNDELSARRFIAVGNSLLRR